MSAKNEREQRRAERIEAEAAETQAARRRRLVQLGAGGVLLAGILVAALIAVSQSGSDEDAADGVPANVAQLLETLPQDRETLGDPQAPATISEFGDLQCPICAEYSSTTVAELIEGPVRRGEANIAFQNWAILGPDSATAAAAALAAGEQDRLWNFIEAFYANQGVENSGYVDEDFLRSIAEEAGVPDIERWERDRDSDRWNAELEEIDVQARGYGFTGTPSFAVSGKGGVERLGTTDSIAEFEAAIASVG